MKRIGTVLLIALLALALVITPVIAKGGSGGSGGKSSGSSKSNNTSTVEKTDKSNQNAKSDSKITKFSNSQEKQNLKNRLQDKMSKSNKKDFSDSNNHWADKYIALSQQLGLVNGYEDGSFKPNASVTTDEAVTMVVNLTDALEGTETTTEPQTTEAGDPSDETATVESGEDTEETSDSTTTDTPEWAQKYVKKASALNIINVNRFHSQVQADRAQVAVMVAKALNLTPVDTQDVTFTDKALINSEDLGYILALKEAGVIQGSPDGKFNPNSSITRAEMATIMAKVVEITSGIETEDATGTTTEANPTSPETTETSDDTGTVTPDTNTTGTEETGTTSPTE